MAQPAIPSWAGAPPDNEFELKNKLSEGPSSIRFNDRSHLILGRSSDATVTLSTTTASRVHALIVHNAEDGQVYVIDLKSAHGTHVDGHRIPPDRPTILKINQEIQFGDNQGGARYEVKTLCARKRVLEGPREDGDSKRSSHQVPVRCSHVLVKHNQSRKLRSDRDPDGKIIRSRSKQEAKAMLEGFIRDLKSEEITFEELAARASDCSSYKRRGDLGFFNYEKMQPSFSKAAFALKIGELSNIVETDSGVHIIKRTG